MSKKELEKAKKDEKKLQAKKVSDKHYIYSIHTIPFQDDIALVVCMIVILILTITVVIVKVNFLAK